MENYFFGFWIFDLEVFWNFVFFLKIVDFGVDNVVDLVYVKCVCIFEVCVGGDMGFVVYCLI